MQRLAAWDEPRLTVAEKDELIKKSVDLIFSLCDSNEVIVFGSAIGGVLMIASEDGQRFFRQKLI